MATSIEAQLLVIVMCRVGTGTRVALRLNLFRPAESSSFMA